MAAVSGQTRSVLMLIICAMDTIMTFPNMKLQEQPHTSTFHGDGPYLPFLVLETTVQMTPAATGCQEPLCIVRLKFLGPREDDGLYSVPSPSPRPLVVFSPGFMVGCDRYASYGRRLASFGFNALMWEPLHEILPFRVNSHETLSLFVNELLEWVFVNNATNSSSVLRGMVDLSAGAMLVGHSRGAKANSLLAAKCGVIGFGKGGTGSGQGVDGRSGVDASAAGGAFVCRHTIKAVVNLDPVDGSGMDKNPSVFPLLPNASAVFLNIGSELGNQTSASGIACAPAGRNYDAFFAASSSPSWLLKLLRVGHMQFLDDPPPLCVTCALLRDLCPGLSFAH